MEAYEAIADEDRRHIISTLLDSELVATVDELMDAIGAATTDSESLRLKLYHQHLPKLEDVGLIEYDWRSGDVVLAADPARLRDVLDALEGEDTLPAELP